MNDPGFAGVAVENKRRALLKFGGAAALLALLPFARGRAESVSATRAPARAALGYWQGGADVRDLHAVRAGWHETGARSTISCDARTSGLLVAASAIDAQPGDYRLRVVGAQLQTPLRLQADHGVAQHDFWQAWRFGEKIHVSANAAIRLHADQQARLPLILRYADGLGERLNVPARAGVYVLALNGADAVRWSDLALLAPDLSQPLNLRMQSADSDVPQYLLLTVEPNVPAARA